MTIKPLLNSNSDSGITKSRAEYAPKDDERLVDAIEELIRAIASRR